MHVQDVMTIRVHRCMPEDSLAQAAQLMWQHDFGCVPVCTLAMALSTSSA